MKTSKRDKYRLCHKEDYTDETPLPDVILSISERLDSRLREARSRGRVIDHNLEHGLGVENVVRELFREYLPLRFGIAKGKIVNSDGLLSPHCDLVIYDQHNCAPLFVDDNANVILPAEAIYAVVEIKSQTNSTLLRRSFNNLQTVAEVVGDPPDCSQNDKINIRPPLFAILSLHDTRDLTALRDDFTGFNRLLARQFSFNVYSKKSPGSKDLTGETFLVQSISVIGKGEVYHFLDGRVGVGHWGMHTFGMLVNSIINALTEINLPQWDRQAYLHWLGAGAREVFETKTKQANQRLHPTRSLRRTPRR